MEKSTIKAETYQKDAVIFKQGDYAPCMYDVLQGKVGIYANYGTEREKKLTELKAGEYFGEMGMLECYPRSATAVALEEGTQIQEITSETFSSYFQENPEKVFAIMRQMSGRIRGLTGDYMEVCRTVAETVDTAKAGREKSGWLKEHLKKFSDAYTESMKMAAQYGDPTCDPMLYYGMMHW